MELQDSNLSRQYSESIQLSGECMVRAEAAQVVPPVISANHSLTTLLPEYEQQVTIDEASLLSGLVELGVTKQIGIQLHGDWQEDSSRSELRAVHSVYGQVPETVTQPSGKIAPVAPYAATIKLGQSPNIAKNEKLANIAFWTGMIACRDLGEDYNGIRNLDYEIAADTRSKRDRMSLLLPTGFVFANIMANSVVRKSLDISTYDYPQVFGVMVGVGLVMAPAFVYAQVKNNERSSISEAEFLAKKHKSQATELAAAYPALRITPSQLS